MEDKSKIHELSGNMMNGAECDCCKVAIDIKDYYNTKLLNHNID